MSNLTANSVLPIVSALPEEEKHALLQALKKMLGPQKPKRKKPDVMDQEHMWLYRPENREILVAKIMNGEKL